MEREDLLKNSRSDITGIVARSSLGAVPIVGPLMSELVNIIIPNQKIDRLIEFLKMLDEKVSHLEKGYIMGEIKKEECSDFIEEALHQASRATSDKRKEYIASIVAGGLSLKDISYNESKHLLRILGEINDIEVIWLRYYLVPTLSGDEEFRARHKDILETQHAYIGAPQNILDKAALQESYKEHLTRLGLLERHYKTDIRTHLPEFNSFTGGLEVSGYEITLLGKLLLKRIGLVEENQSN